MRRYQQDYGLEHRARDARWLRRREAARVLAQPIVRPTNTGLNVRVALAAGAIVVAWALAFVIAFAS